MKNFLIILFFFNLSLISYSQESSKFPDVLLKEVSENACKCIDSITLRNKSADEIALDIHKCIDKQVGALQLGLKFFNINSLLKSGSTKDTIKIEFNTNNESKENKDYYFNIERYLMANCNSIKKTLAASNIENLNSVTDNKNAMKEYDKGVKHFTKQEYAKALPYFERAVKLDSTFAFAWDNLGICNRKVGNYDMALYAYNKSLSIDPTGMMPLQNIPLVYEDKKEYQNAIDAYQTLSQMDSFNPEVFYGIGRIYSFHLKDLEKGLDNMCKAYNLYIKKKSPYRTDAENIINTIYDEMKKIDKINRFNEILKENNININIKN